LPLFKIKLYAIKPMLISYFYLTSYLVCLKSFFIILLLKRHIFFIILFIHFTRFIILLRFKRSEIIPQHQHLYFILNNYCWNIIEIMRHIKNVSDNISVIIYFITVYLDFPKNLIFLQCILTFIIIFVKNYTFL